MDKCRATGVVCEPNDLYWADQKLQWQLEADAKMVAAGGYEWLSTLGHDIAELEGRRFWFHLTYDPSPHARAAAERQLLTEQSERERIPPPATVQAPANNVASTTQFEQFETPLPLLNERLETDVNRFAALGSSPVGTFLWGVGTRLFDLSDPVQDSLIATGQMADAVFAAALGIRAKFVVPKLQLPSPAPAHTRWIDPAAAAKVRYVVAHAEKPEPRPNGLQSERDVLVPAQLRPAGSIVFIGGAEHRPLDEYNHAPSAPALAWKAGYPPRMLNALRTTPFEQLASRRQAELRNLLNDLVRHSRVSTDPVDLDYAHGVIDYLAVYMSGTRDLPTLPEPTAIDLIWSNGLEPKDLLSFLARAERAASNNQPAPDDQAARPLLGLYEDLVDAALAKSNDARTKDQFWDWLDPLERYLQSRQLLTTSIKLEPIKPLADPPDLPKLELTSPHVHTTDVLMSHGLTLETLEGWAHTSVPLSSTERFAAARALDDLNALTDAFRNLSPAERLHAHGLRKTLFGKLNGVSFTPPPPSIHDEIAAYGQFSPRGLHRLLSGHAHNVTEPQWKALENLYRHMRFLATERAELAPSDREQRVVERVFRENASEIAEQIRAFARAGGKGWP